MITAVQVALEAVDKIVFPLATRVPRVENADERDDHEPIGLI